jgi:hypothetical protein
MISIRSDRPLKKGQHGGAAALGYAEEIQVFSVRPHVLRASVLFFRALDVSEKPTDRRIGPSQENGNHVPEVCVDTERRYQHMVADRRNPDATHPGTGGNQQ